MVLADGPFGGYPAVLFEFVQARIERALANLEDLAGHLANALRDGPAVHGFEPNDFQDEEIEGTLKQVGWFAHVLSYQLLTGE